MHVQVISRVEISQCHHINSEIIQVHRMTAKWVLDLNGTHLRTQGRSWKRAWKEVHRVKTGGHCSDLVTVMCMSLDIFRMSDFVDWGVWRCTVNRLQMACRAITYQFKSWCFSNWLFSISKSVPIWIYRLRQLLPIRKYSLWDNWLNQSRGKLGYIPSPKKA